MDTETSGGLIRKTDFLFSLSEKRRDRKNENEDSYAYSLNEERCLLAVFDGCGGSGAARYPAMKGRTGAFLASRTVSAAWLDWFEKLPRGAEPDVGALQEQVLSWLERCEKSAGDREDTEKSRKSRLPTTAASALCSLGRGGVEVLLLWAGDSRVYLLDGEGLAQLTEDDLGGLDAMENLRARARLTNAIRLGKSVKIHTARLTMGRPGLIFAASDGCWADLATPMEFEHLLLSTLLRSPNAQSWEQELGMEIGKRSGDDYTLCGAAFGFGSFDAIKRQLARRGDSLYRTYIYGLEECSPEEKQQLWLHYKDHYQRLLCRG